MKTHIRGLTALLILLLGTACSKQEAAPGTNVENIVEDATESVQAEAEQRAGKR